MIETLKKRHQTLRGEERKLRKQVKALRQEIRTLTQEAEEWDEALILIRTVGLKTQQQLQFHVSDIVSMALEGVFDDPYQLQMEFVERRDKTECDLNFLRDGELVNPLEASGYGAVNVAAFALRVASYTMMSPRLRPVLILDEPLKELSVDRQPYASRMIKELSQKLGIQFIIVTHEEVLTEYADRVFSVNKKDKVSQIKQVL